MENENIKKGKKYLIIGVLVLFLAILGSSVAYYLARVQGSLSGRAAGTGLDLTITPLSTSAKGDLIPLDNDLETLGQAILGYGNNTSNFDSTKSCIDINGYSVCQIYKVTVTNNGTLPLDVTGGVQLVGANTPNIDCAKMDNDTEVTSNNTCIGASTLANNETINENSSKDYYILVYINNLDEPQYDKGEFVGTVSFVSNQGKRVKGRFNETYNAAEFIKDKFDNDSNKTTVTANAECERDESDYCTIITKTIDYKYAPTASLMYDRLGGTTTNLEEGNLRYYGANPNNYIDIGDKYEVDVFKGKWEEYGFPFVSSSQCYEMANCETNYSAIGSMFGQTFNNAAECNAAMPTILSSVGASSLDDICGVTDEVLTPAGTPILWRIIGVFDGNLKIIRNDSIGFYSWDTSPSSVNNGYGINEWSQADIMKLLNPGYENEEVGGSLFWNSGNGSCYYDKDNYTVPCFFENTGLSNEAKGLAIDNIWYLGGFDMENIYSNKAYALERTLSWTGKVGLMSVSDYGYAMDLRSCENPISEFDAYDYGHCELNDWLFHGDTWTMIPTSNNASWGIYSDTSIYEWVTYTSEGYIFPSMYLKKDAVIESGTGTKDDPYIAG